MYSAVRPERCCSLACAGAAPYQIACFVLIYPRFSRAHAVFKGNSLNSPKVPVLWAGADRLNRCAESLTCSQALEGMSWGRDVAELHDELMEGSHKR